MSRRTEIFLGVGGVFLELVGPTFRYSLSYAKHSFFTAVNGLFGKLLNVASETVILELDAKMHVNSALHFRILSAE